MISNFRYLYLLLFGLLLFSGGMATAWADLSIHQEHSEVEAWDYLELTLNVEKPGSQNPFTEVMVTGSCQKEMQPGSTVNGYCDSQDGSRYKLRFMPTEPGSYNYSITYQAGSFVKTFTGSFQVRDGKRKGQLQVHKQFPSHFQWAGTGEPFFWNGTTTYWLLGWEDENVIRQSLDRLAKLKVNNIRVALNGRNHGGKRWDEPLVVDDAGLRYFFRMDPWVAAEPTNVEQPKYDTTRFHLHHWHKCERMLKHARELNIVVEIIFYLDGKDPGVDPFGKENAGCEDEQNYYKHAVARLAAYSNVIWNVSNEYQLFRDVSWVNAMGDFIKKCDPYDHLATVHGEYEFKFRSNQWCDFAAYQCWDEKGGFAYMLENRKDQAATGRVIPQVNEEYGYEDHYPQGWGEARKAPARNADSRRRLAWEISMAGCYQTTGERADRGTGAGANSGGGWINGRGDHEMTMLSGYAHIVAFFAKYNWVAMEPKPELLTAGKGMVLAEGAKRYLVYLPAGGAATLKVEPGKYQTQAYKCPTGEWREVTQVETKDGQLILPVRKPDYDSALVVEKLE
jgi:hypothetical protein